MIETTPKWQTLTEESFERTEVLRVSGGWLFRTRLYKWGTDPQDGRTLPVVAGVALAFQPERS